MDAIQTLIPLVFTVSLAVLIVAVGMDAGPGDLTSAFRHPMRLVRAVLAVNLLVPMVAILVVTIAPVPPLVKAGILVMAASPVPPLVPGKGLKVGGGRDYTYGIYAALALLSVIIVPITVALLGALYGVELRLSAAAVARNVALSVLSPLAIGLAIRQFAPAFAARSAGVFRTVAMILLFVALVPVLIGAWPVLVSLAGNGTMLAMALICAIALLAGHALGGPSLEDRAALAMTAATRHPGIAMMIVAANHPDPRLKAVILDFLLVGLVVAVPYQLWLKRRAAAPATA